MGVHCLNKHPDAAGELRELETMITDTNVSKQNPQCPCSWHVGETAHTMIIGLKPTPHISSSNAELHE
jgi:hypothetical protein